MKDDTVYCKQILDFANDIESYLSGKSFDDFDTDTMLQDAVIRKLELVGEAANRVSSGFLSNNPQFPIREAVSMRNRLIHEYDAVSTQIVWTTATDDIKVVKDFITPYLSTV